MSVMRLWDAEAANGLVFSTKAPQDITHEKVLKDYDEEFETFLTAMETLGEKLDKDAAFATLS